MLEYCSGHAQSLFARHDVARAIRANPAPRQNHILAALPPADYARVQPHLEPVALPPGWAIHSPGEREGHLHFITAGIVSRFCIMENGETAQFAITGREGVIGVSSFLGGESTPSGAVVLTAGHAYRLNGSLLEDRSGPLAGFVLRYTHAMMVQAALVAVCNRHHSLEQQLCRWILSCLDRLPSNEVPMTHALVARMLGVRREGVSQAAERLQACGALRCGRGHIVVPDRRRLEARVCECYWVVNHEYDRVFPSVPYRTDREPALT